MLSTAPTGVDSWRLSMTAITQAISHISTNFPESKVFRAFGMFCGAVLFVLILRATYGLDMSPGFF